MEKNNIKRILCDLDGTLLKQNFSYESSYFHSCLDKEDAEVFIPRIGELLAYFESNYEYYDNDLLRGYLHDRTGINFTNEIIDGWRATLRNYSDTIIDGVPETLEYLKSNGYSLGVLTNWYSEDQIARLKKAGLLEYFDSVIGGDIAFKPSVKSYICATGRFSPSECVMIGDNMSNDVLGAIDAGLDAIYFDSKGIGDSLPVTKVKRINRFDRLKEMY